MQRSDHIRTWVVALAVFTGVLWTDVAFKAWAVGTLVEPLQVTSWFYLAVHHNAGLFLGFVPVSAVSAVYWMFTFCAVVWMGQRMLTVGSLSIAVAYALVAGGFMGNVFGRIQGVVVDYLAFGPVASGNTWLFVNLADLALLAGGILISAVLILKRGRRYEGRVVVEAASANR